MIKIVKIVLKTFNGSWGSSSLAEDAIALISAPIFIVFAIKRRKTTGKTTLLEYFFLTIAARPLPVKRPILAHISWITITNGYVSNTVHSNPNPNFAPAWENVAILDGSSSEAPVIMPGPRDLRKDLIVK